LAASELGPEYKIATLVGSLMFFGEYYYTILTFFFLYFDRLRTVSDLFRVKTIGMAITFLTNVYFFFSLYSIKINIIYKNLTNYEKYRCITMKKY